MKILIIEDDVSLCNALKFQLEKESFTVDTCHDGDDGLFLAQDLAHDLILLDRMLPNMSGLEILKTIRKENNTTPVIMITAMGELNDKISGLDTGADDYIVKPFEFEELMARIRSICRRPKIWENTPALTFADITLDHTSRILEGEKGSCSVSEREAELLELFIRNPRQTLPRDMIINRVWGADSDIEQGNLENYIYFVRRRLNAVSHTLHLKTIRGVGYSLEEKNV